MTPEDRKRARELCDARDPYDGKIIAALATLLRISHDFELADGDIRDAWRTIAADAREELDRMRAFIAAARTLLPAALDALDAAEAEIDRLNTLGRCDNLLNQTVADRCAALESERDRLRAQVEDAQNETRRERQLSSDAIAAARATIAEQARRIEALQESCDIRGAALERAEAAGQQIGHRHARLEQALNMYGAHMIGCDFRRASAAMSGMDCTCGFIDARDAALKEQAAPKGDADAES